jgi:hypothetical protein
MFSSEEQRKTCHFNLRTTTVSLQVENRLRELTKVKEGRMKCQHT